MSRIAIVKIHPGLNMALPQLSGDLVQAGHETRMYFFKQYKIEEEYFNSEFSDDRNVKLEANYTDFEEEYQTLAAQLADFNPDVIGLSVISLSIPEAVKTTQFLRSKFNLPIIWGGVGVTLEPEIAIPHADIICVGEGEEVMVDLADRLDKGEDIKRIEGTWAKTEDGEIIKNARRPSGSLDAISIPDWNPDKMLYITSEKVLDGAAAYKLITDGDYQIMTQRGCPFSCSFCVESRYQEMFGKKNSLRRRSVDVVIEELVRAKETFNPQVIWFWDDVFTLNPRWLEEFLPRYKEEVGIPFWCYTYPTTHKPKLLRQLKDAGCNCISMGVQSGSERVLREVYNRPTPLDRVIEASQEIVDAGIIGYFDLISRSSFEIEEDLRSTFNFLVDLPQEMNYIGVGEMKSYPTYAYTREEEAAEIDTIAKSVEGLDDKTFDYYHNLYWVALNPHLDREEKLRIGADPAYRENPALLEKYYYAHLTVNQAIYQMRMATISGDHPYQMFPPPRHKHNPMSASQAPPAARVSV